MVPLVWLSVRASRQPSVRRWIPDDHRDNLYLRARDNTCSGTVTYVGLVATFTPLSNLTLNTTYTATITTRVTDIDGNALVSNKVWSFTTITALAAGPQPVDLGTDGNFVILSETGITEATPASTHITGNIGTSPITGAAITVACSEMVTGNIYTVDAAGPACSVIDPTGLTTAISDMETAYTDAAGRTTPDFTNLYAGILYGQTLDPDSTNTLPALQ